MKKHTSKAVPLILSFLILLTALSGCNADIADKENQSQSSKMVIFDKEYDDVIDFLRNNGENLNVIPLKIADCFFFCDKESLKQYYEKEEDWVRDIEECIPDGPGPANEYRLSLDNRFILTGTDDRGRNTISLKVDVYGDYPYIEGEVVPNGKDGYISKYISSIRVSLVRTGEGEWPATGVIIF